MAAPSAASVSEDAKELREDLHKFETAVTADVRELSVQVKGILSSIRILGVLTLTSLAGSIWWGATLTADVKNLGARFDERSKSLDARLDKLEAKVDARFDKLEASIVRALEQAKPAPR